MADPVNFSSEASSDFIFTEATRCVSCGLCLPHCPTYYLTKSEADSPRGRIAMMNGVARGHIPMNERFIQHMDRCLTCRACESVCPNNVAYGQLIDEARVMIAASTPSLKKRPVTKKKTKLRILLEKEFIIKPARFDRLRLFFYFFQKSGLQQWLQKSILLRKTKFIKLITQLPPISLPRSSFVNEKKTAKKAWQQVYPAQGKTRGEVGLFLGCVARLTDVITLNSAIFVLNRLGYIVYVPLAQTCCGALHQHSGEPKTAMQLAQKNKMVFEGLNLQTVINTASGCGVQLAELRSEQVIKFVSNIDISKFLATAEGWGDVDILPLPYKVAVHDPCSLRNGLSDQVYPYTLLSYIPAVEIVPLAGNSQCCGAAGTYFIDQPELAQMLLNDKLSAIADSGARYLATSNIGCSLHISSGLRERGLDIEVLHPVTLLARQMGIQL